LFFGTIKEHIQAIFVVGLALHVGTVQTGRQVSQQAFIVGDHVGENGFEWFVPADPGDTDRAIADRTRERSD
jgi:hypothetical protein